MALYLLYVLIFGGYFSLKYLISEQRIKSSKEFILLLLFPMAGYGNWLYNKTLRESKSPVLPRKWFIWKKMIRQNIFLIILSIIGIGSGTVIGLYYKLSSDGALNFSSGSITILENNIDPTLGIGIFFTAIATIFYLCIFTFLLVIIPAIITNSIKKNYNFSPYTKYDSTNPQ